MHRPSLGLRAILLACALATARSAAAQDEDCLPPGAEEIPSQPVCNIAPVVTITPPGASLAQPTVTVSVRALDHYNGGILGSFQILLDGQGVTSQWAIDTVESGTGTGRRRTYTATGQVALTPGTPVRTLQASLCDTATCTQPTATFTLDDAGVTVTRGVLSVAVYPAATRTLPFDVRNTGTRQATFALAAECRDGSTGLPVTPCSVSPASLTLAAGDTLPATATFPAVTGSLVNVRVRATHTGSPHVWGLGWTDVIVQPTPGTGRAAPLVEAVPLNAGGTVERSLCVSLPVGAGSGYECGDVRVAHGLPAHRIRGGTWAPALLYSGHTAHPRPAVYADVTLPAGAAQPTSVELVVTMQNGTVHRAAFPGASFAVGVPRRVGVQWDGMQMGTGLYPYTLEVVNHYPDESVSSLAIGGEVAVVNWAGSYFGAGWALSGVERIHCVDCSTGGSRFLWVGADGSTRVYEPPVNGAWTYWVATHPDRRRDTLKLVGGEYHLRTPGGDSVFFNGAGLHARTVNRLGQVTQLTWGTLGLEAIHAPGGGPGTGGPSWTLAWDYPAGLVRGIDAVAPGAPTRTTHLTFGTRRRVTAITDPDSGSVQFAYPDSQTLISRHRDRRGTYAHFGYNGYRKLSASRLQMGASTNDSVDVVLSYTPAEAQGLALDGATAGTPVLTVRAYTRIDGPRKDVADQVLVWHSRAGAVSRVRDPLGAETHLEYGNPFFPTLPTRVTADGAPTVAVRYDTRGRVDTVTVLDVLGDGRDHVTAYAYDDRWDAPDTVRSYERTGSGPLVALAGGAAYAAYDPQTGNVLWRQQGDDPARRVTFGYVASGSARGLPAWVRRPSGVPGQTARDSLVYDAAGNLSRTVSPLGFLTLHYRDALGRDTLTVSPTTAAGAVTEAGVLATGVRQRVTYSVMDRVTHAMRIGPALTQDGAIGYIPATTGADTLTVETTFDAGGLPLVVARYAAPDTAHVATVATTYTYDAAGRVRTETHGLATRAYEYDLAGNVAAVVTPRGHRITSTYDAGGRLVRRVVPGVSYARECPSNTSPCDQYYPYHPTGGAGALAIPEEWTNLRYDAAGRLAWAANGDAVVWRSYFPNGALRTDSIALRALRGTEFAPEHRYGITYGYRVGGQVSSVQHPSLAGPQNTDLFTHDAATGAVASLTSRLGHVFEFERNAAGQLTSLRAPGYTDSTVYDLGGRVVRRLELGATGGVVNVDSLGYDARGKVIDVYANGQSRARQWYSGSGMLVGTDWQNTYNPAVQQEAFGMDALGNMSWRRSGNGGTTPQLNVHQYTYHPTFAAVTEVELTNLNDPMSGYLPERSTREYDAAGNVTWAVFEAMGELGNGTIGPIRYQRGRSYYDAADRIRYYQERDLRGGLTIDIQGVFEEYRYDPLGRRVLVDTRTEEICTSNAFRCSSATTRFVWAGNDLLWEVKRYSESPGESAGEAGAYGTVGYTHGGGIDRPLVITKNGQSVLPHMNWRGEFARGTYPSGASSDCPVGVYTGCTLIAWPGWRTTAWHRDPSEPDIRTWWGSLSNGKYDASGRSYMRNREYDPATGQFTQMDPIGLAGGLSSYGFAGGDPVNNFDPFGTEAEPKGGGFVDCSAYESIDDKLWCWTAFGYWLQQNAGQQKPLPAPQVFENPPIEFRRGRIESYGSLLDSSAWMDLDAYDLCLSQGVDVLNRPSQSPAATRVRLFTEAGGAVLAIGGGAGMVGAQRAQAGVKATVAGTRAKKAFEWTSAIGGALSHFTTLGQLIGVPAICALNQEAYGIHLY